eukprot:14928760-Alexandrium_andersonii.AAC.1
MPPEQRPAPAAIHSQWPVPRRQPGGPVDGATQGRPATDAAAEAARSAGLGGAGRNQPSRQRTANRQPKPENRHAAPQKAAGAHHEAAQASAGATWAATERARTCVDRVCSGGNHAATQRGQDAPPVTHAVIRTTHEQAEPARPNWPSKCA